MIVEQIPEAKIGTLLGHYNRLTGKSLKRWSRKRSDLEEAVAKLLGDAAVEDAKAVVSEAHHGTRGRALVAPGTVGAYVESMLTTDAAYDEIVAAVRERFPGGKNYPALGGLRRKRDSEAWCRGAVEAGRESELNFVESIG